MAKNLQLLRNSNVGITKNVAHSGLVDKLKNSLDGEPVLARYTEGDKVKTLLGISGGNGENTYTIFDIDAVPSEVQKIINDLKGGTPDTNYDTITKIADALKKINGEADVDGSIKKALADANAYTNAEIQKLDKADTAIDGEFVDSVSEENGVITVTRKAVAADKVTTTPITSVESGENATVAVDGTNVAAQIASLGKTLKTVQDNAAKYEVLKLTDDEVTALGDENVKEAYKVVSYVGDEAAATKTQVGDTIKIYKDASLLSVTSSGDENTIITFKYALANGTEETVSVDLGKAIFESEMGDGIKVVNSKIAIELDTATESFLTVGADGLKLSGVQNAIDTAVGNKNVAAEGDAYVSATAANNKVTVTTNIAGLTVNKSGNANSTLTGTANKLVDGSELATKVSKFVNDRIGEEVATLDATVGSTTVANGKHVAVQVVETDGKLTGLTVTENDIASAASLTSEINRAKAAEDKIEASVGLDANGSHVKTSGNYTKDATTVVGEIAALDTALKNVSDAAISVEAGNGITVSSNGTEKTIAVKIKDADPILEVTTNGIAAKENAVWDCGTY